MNGRCETNPLDQATNVCGTCYGDFCDACLVTLKGRKNPTCKDCAIIASGVRGSAKPELRGSRSTAAERRRAYQAVPSEEKVFEYFDTSTEVKEPSYSEIDQAIGMEMAAADEGENDSAESQRKRRSFLKKKTPEISVDTSDELQRVQSLSESSTEHAEHQELDESDSTKKGKTKTRRKKRDSSAIDKLEKIQSTEAPPLQAKKGRRVPPRKAPMQSQSGEREVSKMVDPDPTQVIEQPIEETEPITDADTPSDIGSAKLAPTDADQTEIVDTAVDHISPPPPPTAKPKQDTSQTKTLDTADHPIPPPPPTAKSDTNQTKTLNTASHPVPPPPPTAKPNIANKPGVAGTAATEQLPSSEMSLSTNPFEKGPVAPIADSIESTTPDQSSEIEQPLQKPAKEEGHTSRTESQSAATKAGADGDQISDKNSKVRPKPRKEWPQKRKDTPGTDTATASRSRWPTTAKTAAPQREEATNKVEPTSTAPISGAAILNKLTDASGNRPRETAPTADAQETSQAAKPIDDSRVDHVAAKSQPPPPNPTQRQGSAKNMPVVGSVPADEDSPTREFRDLRQLSSIDQADRSASEDSDSSEETWDPNATPWDNTSNPWDKSAPFDDSTPETAPSPTPAGDPFKTDPTPTSESRPSSSVEALIYGRQKPESDTGTSVLEPEPDATRQMMPIDDSELDDAGNWVPPALRGTGQDRRSKDA